MITSPQSAAAPTRHADPTDATGFLAKLRHHTGMAGAAIMGAETRWLEISGTAPPTGLAHDLFGATGVVASDADAAARFIVVVPIPNLDTRHAQWLVMWDERSRAPAEANLLLAQLSELVAHAAMSRARAAQRHRHRLIERASETARIGIWHCSLPDEDLFWSDGVYDLFELPRGSSIDRQQILEMYVPESAARMQVLRAKAIDTLGDFSFDAEILTARGNRRWMRITATVDGIDGRARRIFGMKQNITQEKLMAERTRLLAETDALTGLANRAMFQSRLDDMHGRLGATPIGALLLVDLDHFKMVNDELGHALGDACLVEAGNRLRAACPPGAQVSRIGGDEFAILTDGQAPIDLPDLCDSVVSAFQLPFQLGGQTKHIGVSIGLAMAEKHDADSLYRNADLALYQAKAAGRGTWRPYRAA